MIERKFTVFDMLQGKKRDVVQYHYLGWPVYGIPSDESLEEFDYVLQEGISKLISTKDEKIVFHCSAGIGRTGTTIALIHLIMNLIAQKEQSLM